MDHSDPLLRVVHEDERLVAVAKPSGQLAVGPADRADPSLQAEASRHVGRDLLIVHRLDRGTSGIILFAKDVETHHRLSLLFESRKVDKVYIALVLGHLEPSSGEVDGPLRAFGSGRMGVDTRGKESLTRYSLIERLAATDLLEVRPLTGRRHQIRVHLYAIGHPVLGNTRYGDARPVGGAGRLMLHAQQLTFPDADGASITIRAEPRRSSCASCTNDAAATHRPISQAYRERHDVGPDTRSPDARPAHPW